MSDSDWRKRPSTRLVLFAVVCFIALLAAISAISYGLYQNSKHEREANERYQEHAAHTYYPKRDACLKFIFLSQKDCIAKAETEAREYERGEQDLVAQRITATWTALMGSAAILGMLLSVIGVYLVWTTFRATKEGNEVAREVGQAQARAYLSVADGKYSITERAVIIHPTFVNKGQSPAKRVTFKVQILFTVGEEYLDEQHLRTPEATGTCDDIAAIDEQIGVAFMGEGFVGLDHFGELRALPGFYMIGQVEWFDVFDRSQTIKIDLHCHRTSPPFEGRDTFDHTVYGDLLTQSTVLEKRAKNYS